MKQFTSTNVSSSDLVCTPEEARRRSQLTSALAARVSQQRQAIRSLIQGTDNRLLVIVGPCSVHNAESALAYADRLAEMAVALRDTLYLVMRVYVEKPRTELGWQGFLLDPYLNGGDVNAGIHESRELMKKIIDRGLPVATEFLSPITATYLQDMVAWSAIGARTVESQWHRNFASGLAMPVGCKNSRSGSIDSAISMLVTSGQPQQYLNVGLQGRVESIKTHGNPDCHVVLRGGIHGPNWSRQYLQATAGQLQQRGLPSGIVVDCSHDNSGQDFRNQAEVACAVTDVFCEKAFGVRGIMLESFLQPGRQKLQPNVVPKPDRSITDGCMGFTETKELLHRLAETIRMRGMSDG